MSRYLLTDELSNEMPDSGSYGGVPRRWGSCDGLGLWYIRKPLNLRLLLWYMNTQTPGIFGGSEVIVFCVLYIGSCVIIWNKLLWSFTNLSLYNYLFWRVEEVTRSVLSTISTVLCISKQSLLYVKCILFGRFHIRLYFPFWNLGEW